FRSVDSGIIRAGFGGWSAISALRDAPQLDRGVVRRDAQRTLTRREQREQLIAQGMTLTRISSVVRQYDGMVSHEALSLTWLNSSIAGLEKDRNGSKPGKSTRAKRSRF
ncbi:hypothetical protein BGZ65_010117, partial [Modicella reniformis]